MELRRRRVNVSGECKLMRALRGENADSHCFTLSGRPLAFPASAHWLLLLLTSTLREEGRMFFHKTGR